MSDWYESAALLLRYVFLVLGAFIFARCAWMTFVDSARASSLRQMEEKSGAIAYFSLLDKRGKKKIYPIRREGTVGTQRSADVRIGGVGLEKKHFYYEIIDGGIEITPLDGAWIRLEGSSEEIYEKRALRPGHVFYAGEAEIKYAVYLISKKPISPALKRAYGSITDHLVRKK